MANIISNSLVYIVDDEFAVRDSLVLLIESTGQAVKSYGSSEDFLQHYTPEQPACLVLDVRMPGISGLELQQELSKREINIPIIFISGHAEIPDSARAFRAGAIDFLEKPFDNIVLMERINEAINKDVTEKAQFQEKSAINQRLQRLTAREREVMGLLIGCYSNKEVAKILKISHRTIDVHRARIMEKMEAENITDLMVMAIHNDNFHNPSLTP